MKRFNKCLVDGEELLHEGSYQLKDNDYLFIDTKDYVLYKYFTRIKRDLKHISSIEFLGIESEDLITDRFMVKSTFKNTKDNYYEINLKRS